MTEIVLVNISGRDRKEITLVVSELLARYHVSILDFGQSVIHDFLNLGILIQLNADISQALLFKDLVFQVSELGFNVRFTPIHASDYDDWVSKQYKTRYIITLLARALNAEQMAQVCAIVQRQELTITGINRLSHPTRSDACAGQTDQKVCIEFSLQGQPCSPVEMKAQLLEAAGRLGADIAFQKDNAFRRNRRLVVFDMDSTLIEGEVIDELAAVAGVGPEVAAITHQAMRGEIGFKESFQQRLSLLEGLDASVLESVAAKLALTEGAEQLVKALKKLGYKTAIISGGFKYFGEILKNRLGIDFVFANELNIQAGLVTGKVAGEIVDGARKAALLQELARREQINLEQVIAIGDGANDLPMLNLAGLGIAFRAKPIVKQNAEHAISTLGLDSVLYLMGVRDSDQLDLLGLS